MSSRRRIMCMPGGGVGRGGGWWLRAASSQARLDHVRVDEPPGRKHPPNVRLAALPHRDGVPVPDLASRNLLSVDEYPVARATLGETLHLPGAAAEGRDRGMLPRDPVPL